MKKMVEGFKMITRKEEILFLMELKRLGLLKQEHISQAITKLKKDLRISCKVAISVSSTEMEIVLFPIHETVKTELVVNDGRFQLLVDRDVKEDITLLPDFAQDVMMSMTKFPHLFKGVVVMCSKYIVKQV